ncbi:MAG: hypothetical protein OEZ47_17575 [Gammaproteobacteria bacterium]|nr:hypothetical protein [Gammaproteobacteria bacterium]
MLSQHSLSFYKYWRENYRWPLNNTPQSSEERIAGLLSETRIALRNLNSLGKPLLQKIHFWKTQNRGRTTDKYAQILDNNTKIIPNLQKLLFSVSKPTSLQFIEELISVLRIKYANLPVCSAQISFLCNRTVPILDRFVAQFFSRTVSPRILDFAQFNMREVLRDITTVSFVIEDDGTYRCRPRLAVYQKQNFVRNRDLFVSKLLPELNRIAKELNNQQVTYQDIYGKPKEFTGVDVEMAVFAFGTQNRHYFQCWYEGQPIYLDF